MVSFKLGNDVYLEFNVKINRAPAIISSVSAELYRDGEYLRTFVAKSEKSRVSGLIVGGTFSTTGDYVAKFRVGLDSMGVKEHAVPFRITKSVLGKKRAKTIEKVIV